MVPNMISNPILPKTGPSKVVLSVSGLFWKARPSIRSRRRRRNIVVHFWSALENRAVFVPVLETFLNPRSSNSNQKLIVKPVSKRILPQTIIFKSQGRPKEEKVPKRLTKRSLGGVVEVTVS